MNVETNYKNVAKKKTKCVRWGAYFYIIALFQSHFNIFMWVNFTSFCNVSCQLQSGVWSRVEVIALFSTYKCQALIWFGNLLQLIVYIRIIMAKEVLTRFWNWTHCTKHCSFKNSVCMLYVVSSWKPCLPVDWRPLVKEW